MTDQNISDVDLQKIAAKALNDIPTIDASGIVVIAELGFISLKGHVADRQQKADAEVLMRGIRGVKDVFNYLDLRPKGLLSDINLNHNVI